MSFSSSSSRQSIKDTKTTTSSGINKKDYSAKQKYVDVVRKENKEYASWDEYIQERLKFHQQLDNKEGETVAPPTREEQMIECREWVEDKDAFMLRRLCRAQKYPWKKCPVCKQ